MGRDILALKMGDDSHMIEDMDLGNPLFFIHEQTKHLPDNEFYKWIAELHFLKLTDEKGKDFEAFQKKHPKMVQPDFLLHLDILSFNLYCDYYYDEIQEAVGKERIAKLADMMQEVMSKKMKDLKKFHFNS